LVAATAFACANLATIKPDRKSGKPGTTVAVKGFNFTSRSDASAVQLRMDSRRGEVLGEQRADSKGRVETTFRVPKLRAGNHVILATQIKADGDPVAGTPARHPFKVRKASGSSSGVVPTAWASPQQGPPPAARPAPIPVAPIGGAALALMALSAGGFAVARISRRSAGMRTARSLSS